MATYTHKQIQEFARGAGFPDIKINSKSGQVPLLALMSAISTQESGRKDEAYGTIAKGREISIGIFQINTVVHKNYSIAQLRNPVINAKEAYRIYKSQGLNAWGAYYDNKYKKYLQDALNAYNNNQGGNAVILQPNQILPALNTGNNSVNNNITLPNNNAEKDYTPYYILGALGLVLVLKT